MPRGGQARCAAPVQQVPAIAHRAAVRDRPAAATVPPAPPRHAPAAVRPVAAVAAGDSARGAADDSEPMLARSRHLWRMLTWVVAIIVATGALAVGVRLLEPTFAFFPTAGEDATPAAAGIAFARVTIPTDDGERLQLWSMAHPQPRATVVYFHG